MLDVKIQALFRQIWRKRQIADTVYGDGYEETETYYIAEVNGTRWTRTQTTQAIKDALACRCGGRLSDCACCLIRDKYLAVTQNNRKA